MTRSSTNKLFTPYKELKREFRSSRRHFKSLSLDELRSPDFNLFSDQEYSEEEEAEAMAKTMEQYMSKTRTDYGSGVARPKIKEKDTRTRTLYQAWERLKELLMKCPQHYLTEMQELILFYNGLDVPTRQILDSRGPFQLRQLQMLKRPSKKWQNNLKNGIMEHLEEVVLRHLMDWLLYKHN
ncbi:hypothetical protein Tco_0865350 [Tanacetum coccineum]